MDVRAAVAHIHKVMMADRHLPSKMVQNRDLAIPCSQTGDSIYLTLSVVSELAGEDVVRGNDSFESRLDYLLRPGGDELACPPRSSFP